MQCRPMGVDEKQRPPRHLKQTNKENEATIGWMGSVHISSTHIFSSAA